MSQQPARNQPAARHAGPVAASPPQAGQRDAGQEDLDAYIDELVDAAPPLSGEQRDTLALLLRRPRRR